MEMSLYKENVSSFCRYFVLSLIVVVLFLFGHCCVFAVVSNNPHNPQFEEQTPQPLVTSPPQVLVESVVPKNEVIDPFLRAIIMNDFGAFRRALDSGLKPSDLAMQSAVDLKNIYFLSLFFVRGIYPPKSTFFTDSPELQELFRQFQIFCPLYSFYCKVPDLLFVNLVRISQNSAGMAPSIFYRLQGLNNIYVHNILLAAEYAAFNNAFKFISFNAMNPQRYGQFNSWYGNHVVPEGSVEISTPVLFERYPDRFSQRVMTTLIHELTHAVMFFVFNNNCNPYTKGCDVVSEFEHAFSSCLSRSSCWNEVETRVLGAIKDSYEVSQYHEEMIARFVELLVFGMTLERAQEIMPEMLIFWKDHILPAFADFSQSA